MGRKSGWDGREQPTLFSFAYLQVFRRMREKNKHRKEWEGGDHKANCKWPNWDDATCQVVPLATIKIFATCATPPSIHLRRTQLKKPMRLLHRNPSHPLNLNTRCLPHAHQLLRAAACIDNPLGPVMSHKRNAQSKNTNSGKKKKKEKSRVHMLTDLYCSHQTQRKLILKDIYLAHLKSRFLNSKVICITIWQRD